jgi:DNA-binding transcriptional LysR family regulator
VSEDITLGQLRTFVCAAKLGSFVKAADSLGISQPAVSDQISTLESRLRDQLFQRRKGTTPVLTPRGMAVLREAESILEANDRILRNLAEGTQRETIRIAIGPHLRDRYFNPLIGEIYRHYPQADIELHPMQTYDDALRQLDKGDLDILVSTIFATGQTVSRRDKVCDVPVGLITTPELADRIASGETALEEQDLLVPFGQSPRSSRWISHSLKEAGLNFARPPRYFNNGEMVQRIANEGLGLAYLMLESVERELAEGILAVLEPALPPLNRVLAVAPESSEAVGFIEAALRKTLTGNPALTGSGI